jgi:hypothetical protein
MRRPKPTATVLVNLRVKGDLWRKLEAAAKAHEVSLNEEIRKRLRDSFEAESLERRYGELEESARGLDRSGRSIVSGIERFNAVAAQLTEQLELKQKAQVLPESRETKSPPEEKEGNK